MAKEAEEIDDQKPVDDKSDDKGDKSKKTEGDDGWDAEELASAKSLFKALKDPDTSREIIETLAKRIGLLDKDEENKESKKETKKTLEGRVTKIFKSKLGKDYEKFSDTIGPLLDDAIREYLDEHFEKTSSASRANSWEEAVDKFTENHEMNKKIENKMTELMEEAPPNTGKKGFNAQKYLERMWKNALEELDMEVPQKSKRRGGDDDEIIREFTVRPAPTNRTVDDAIDAAMKGIRWK